MAQVVIGMTQNGREVVLAPDDTIIVRLPENPTTGFRWELESPTGPLELIADENADPASSGIGASAERILTFRSRGIGTVVLQLKRWRTWEGPSSIDATFSCTLRVTGQ